MIFKSRQVNLDPEPYTYDGFRATRAVAESQARWSAVEHVPRPEFEPTRDPKPYEWNGYRYTPEQRNTFPGQPCNWSPRREQFDTPVNPILVAFRRDQSEEGGQRHVLSWAEWLEYPTTLNRYTPEQIDHARRVLTRLANWSAE